MRSVFKFLIGAAVLTCTFGQPPQCSDECTRYILDDPNGPGVLRLSKELSMPDGPGTQKVNEFLIYVLNLRRRGWTPEKFRPAFLEGRGEALILLEKG